MKKVIISCIKCIAALTAFLSVINVSAQFAYNYVRAADDYYKKGDYYSAAQYYEKALSGKVVEKVEKQDPYVVEGLGSDKNVKKLVKPSGRQEIVYKTAESYRLLNNYVKAGPYYKESADAAGNPYPYARYWYAKSLHFNSKFAEAEMEFNTFLQQYTTEDAYKEDAAKEIESLKFIQSELKKDVKAFTVNKISAEGIVHGADYAPAILNGSSLVFTSTRADSTTAGKNPYINRLYQGDALTSNTTAASKLNIPQNKDFHQGAAAFSADGNKVFLTRWSSKKDGKKTASIFTSENNSGKWSEPVELKGDVNMDGYSSQQPFITPSGDLLYASDKPGGAGKFDLWMAHMDQAGNTSASTNLGSTINTKEDEEAPYYFQPAGALVFSSNGRVGLGGFDFYQSKGSLQSLEAPVNMGYPVNSVKDDIYIASKGEKYLLDNVFFSSDRSSECCLEMYTLAKKRNKKIITGLVVDCKTKAPIQGASVKVYDGVTAKVVETRTTNAGGSYELSLDEYQPLKITAQAEGYPLQSLEVTKPANEESDLLTNPDICLNKPEEPAKPYEVNKPVVLNNIYYDFGKATIRPESHTMLDSLAADMKRSPGMVIELSAHTDNLGADTYNQRLSERRAQSCVDYLAGQGIDTARMIVKGYGESQPIAPNKKPNGKDNPEGRKKNRRTEFKVLHY